jgi:lysozyme family protein
MPKSVALDIYNKKYWKTTYYDCDTLATGVDLAVFDYGVNSGPSRAYNALMASVGGDSVDTINKICNQRMHFVRGLGTWGRFGVGWTRRITGIRSKAVQMAKGQIINRGKLGTILVGGGAGGAAAAAHWNLWSYWPYALLGVVVVGLIIWSIERFKNAMASKSVE